MNPSAPALRGQVTVAWKAMSRAAAIGPTGQRTLSPPPTGSATQLPRPRGPPRSAPFVPAHHRRPPSGQADLSSQWNINSACSGHRKDYSRLAEDGKRLARQGNKAGPRKRPGVRALEDMDAWLAGEAALGTGGDRLTPAVSFAFMMLRRLVTGFGSAFRVELAQAKMRDGGG